MNEIYYTGSRKTRLLELNRYILWFGISHLLPNNVLGSEIKYFIEKYNKSNKNLTEPVKWVGQLVDERT